MANLTPDSASPQTPALKATHSTNGQGINVQSEQGVALEACSKQMMAIYAHAEDNIGVYASGGTGVQAVSVNGHGVYAKSVSGTGVQAESDSGYGVYAYSKESTAVYAQSESGSGVFVQCKKQGTTSVTALNESGIGVQARSTESTAVHAYSESGIGIEAHSIKGTAVNAQSDSGYGIKAYSKKNTAVVAETDSGTAIYAHSYKKDYSGYLIEAGAKQCTAAVYGHTENGYGVQGISVGNSTRGTDVGVIGSSTNGHGVIGRSTNGDGIHAESSTVIGVRASGGQYAGYFDGIVMVTGDVQLQNADCAEDFDIVNANDIEPGTVMVIDSEGALRPSAKAYDRGAAGVVSGAGDFKPGLVLGKQPGKHNRMPIALIGKVFCKVDAEYSPIQVGDWLTTSATPGFAMKATDSTQAFGAVIGKALRPLARGRGLIPILVTLQ